MINQLLEKLNPEQLKPVLETDGAVLVIAGAGSGKTRVLTTRIAYLVQEKHIPPSRIMAITFTNKAAGEMKERLGKIIVGAEDMWVSTIHSMCVRILRSDIEKLGYGSNFSIYDETDKDKTLKRVIADLNLDAEKVLKPAKNAISAAKNDCMSPEEYLKENRGLRFAEEIYSIYSAYEKELFKNNALDFDDLLFKTYLLFEDFPEVADYYSNKFLYIHIDEFQDTNKVQFYIAKRLAASHGNIFAVGDDDQSIYGWRGARVENILNFDETYRGAKVFKLERNYRSTKKILELANCIIANNTGRRGKNLWTENPDGVKVETFVGSDENNEATYTAIQIKNLMARYSDLAYGDIAVFMRINALSRAYEQEFTKYGIPYRIFGGFRFYERKEVKDLLSYLKLVNNPRDDESFLRAISVPKRGIGDKTLRELREFAAINGDSLLDAAQKSVFSTLGGAATKKLTAFAGLIDGFKLYSKNNSPDQLLAHIIRATSFNEQFAEQTEENTARLYNISELLNSAEQFVKDNAGAELSDYLNSVTLSSDTDDLNSDNAVTVATIHAAKGLEYKCVFVAGLDEEVLPIVRESGREDDMEEERRLMYVAVTRAKERLYLTRANSRYMYGSRKYMRQSRFLREAAQVLNPQQLSRESERREYSYGRRNASERDGYGSYDERDDLPGGSSGYSSTYAASMLAETSKPQPIKKVTGGYKTGVKVKHVKFGEGTVIDVRGEGDNIIVNVAFKGVGIKALSVKYAPMEII